MSDFDVTADGWLPRRGDYGAAYAFDLIPLVEATSCVLGCRKAGHEDDVAEFGPGGSCVVLMNMSIATDRVPIEPRDDGPRCTVREAP